MLEVKQTRQKASLDKHQGKKDRVCPKEAMSGDVGETQRCLLPLQGENLCGQSAIGDEADQK